MIFSLSRSCFLRSFGLFTLLLSGSISVTAFDDRDITRVRIVKCLRHVGCRPPPRLLAEVAQCVDDVRAECEGGVLEIELDFWRDVLQCPDTSEPRMPNREHLLYTVDLRDLRSAYRNAGLPEHYTLVLNRVEVDVGRKDMIETFASPGGVRGLALTPHHTGDLCKAEPAAETFLAYTDPTSRIIIEGGNSLDSAFDASERLQPLPDILGVTDGSLFVTPPPANITAHFEAVFIVHLNPTPEELYSKALPTC